jgi:hypothetical protein
MWTVFFIGLAVFLVGSLIFLEFRPHRRGLRDRSTDSTANQMNLQGQLGRQNNRNRF